MAFDEAQAERIRQRLARRITGRAMKGWVLVAPAGVQGDDQLGGWMRRALKFVGTLPAK